MSTDPDRLMPALQQHPFDPAGPAGHPPTPKGRGNKPAGPGRLRRGRHRVGGLGAAPAVRSGGRGGETTHPSSTSGAPGRELG